ncbi:MAG: M14 family zinc carboxypeptidase [Candidatus Saccharicenans sp.]|nr:M14 family zinc carboxypeptidase [Candidatus Saccharicenans sp.]
MNINCQTSFLRISLFNRQGIVITICLLLLSLISPVLSAASPAQATSEEKITTPESFFGFQLGADRKIARWDKIVEYFGLLEKESPKIKVINMGPTTMGHPFLLVIISAPENLADLERIKRINHQISDPRQVPAEEIPLLISQGKAIVCQSMSLHADEIGGTQMAPELAYDLISRNDAETRRILENVVFLLIPSFNPDGQIMVTDWYNQTLGTEYEGTPPPYLYHKYAGHDNNRDGDFLNLQESIYAARILYQEWKPQAYVDRHHMGSYGPRLYVPPYCDPIRPYADPLLWRELSWFGGHLAYRLEEAGKTGIINDAMFSGWGHFGWHWITPFHNIVGMLTESASARLASPLFIQPDQLRGESLQFPVYEAQSNFPHPWEGGWWRLRDIVEQQKIAAWAVLDLAARHRETILYNSYLKAARQTERGASEKPRAFIIPAEQHDRLTAVKLVNTLLQSDIEIHRLNSELRSDGIIYPAGSFLISLAQPKRGLIMNLLGRTFYPDNYWTRSREGNPQRPYDLATHTMAEFMGVRVDPLDNLPEANLELIVGPIKAGGQVRAGAAGYRLDGRLNDSFTAASLLLDNKIQVLRADLKTEELNPGDFIVPGASFPVLESIAARTGVDFMPLTSLPVEGAHRVRRLRVGLYQRFYTGNIEEGWTRLLLEKFELPYVTIRDADIKGGQLAKKIDLLILPADSTAMIMGEGQDPSRRRGNFPPEYRSGLGQDGLEKLKEFTNHGGVLVCLGAASNFAIEKLGLRLRNVVAEVDSKEFFCPGSTLKVSIDNLNPLAYGLPEKGLVLFFSSPAFEILPGNDSEKYRVVVRYAERDILQSGWLIGEKYLSKTAAMVEAAYGQGQVILIGLRAQHRAQTHGTFKLLFNTFIR